MSAFHAPLSRFLIMLHNIQSILGCFLSVCFKCFLASLLGFLVCHCLLTLKNILQRLGCLKVEELTVIGVDSVFGLIFVKLQFLNLFRIPLALRKRQFLKLLVDFVKFSFFCLDKSNLFFVLSKFVSLDLVLRYTLKCIRKERTSRLLFGVTNGIFLEIYRILLDISIRICYTTIDRGCVEFTRPPFFCGRGGRLCWLLNHFYGINIIQDFFAICGSRNIKYCLPNGIFFILNICFPRIPFILSVIIKPIVGVFCRATTDMFRGLYQLINKSNGFLFGFIFDVLFS